MPDNSTPKKKRFYHNFKPTMLLLLLPLGIGAFAIYYAISGPLRVELSNYGSQRLVTQNWQYAYANLANSQPTYGPKQAYYKVKLGQNINWVAHHFSINEAQLKQLNPGNIVYGTTIVIPPVQSRLKPSTYVSTDYSQIELYLQDGQIHLKNDFRNPTLNVTIPSLAKYLAPQGAITDEGNKEFRLNKPIVLENNIRLDVTNKTVNKLELASRPNYDVTCLCFENAEALIENTKVTSVDPATGKPDLNQIDGRSFIRALKSTRMDVINSDISYLGNGLLTKRATTAILRDGATYGTSWRISDGSLGRDIATGWVEGNNFHNNHFGAYSYGASGIMWKNNLFYKNEVYGLDPHDDSNNATVVGNRFVENGKHGFIVSKRCDYNVIKNNISIGNKLHGFMLHQDSNYNVIEDNVSIGNVDNYVLFASNFDTIRNNKSYNPESSHVRIDGESRQSFVQNNQFYGGSRGIYLYDNTDGVLIEKNNFAKLSDNVLATDTVSRVLFTNNNIEDLQYRMNDGDRVVFGPNNLQKSAYVDLRPLQENYL